MNLFRAYFPRQQRPRRQPPAPAFDTAPTVRAVRTRAGLLRIRCPFCGRKHTHGAPTDAVHQGHREAHCRYPSASARLGYFIVVDRVEP